MTRVQHVVVIGGGVAGLAAAWALTSKGIAVEVLEASARLGGLVETERTDDGFVIEHGPDAILEARPAAREVIDALGMSDQLVREGPAPRRAYVADEAGHLVPLPEGLAGLVPRAPFALFGSPLLSAAGKARLMFEPLVSRSAPESTSVARFVERRMGHEPRARLVDPLLRAIYGVRGDELDLDATMPHLRAMVRDHGSLGLAVLRASRRPPTPGLAALRGGMDTLIGRLAGAIGTQRIVRRTTVLDVVRASCGRFRVRTSSGAIDTDAVVVAVPAPTAAQMLGRLSSDLASELSAVKLVDADVVTLAYDRRAVDHPLDGTGHVVATPGARTRACTWASMKWHARAPEGAVLFRSVIDASGATDDEVIELARLELEPLLDIRARPRLTRLRRRRSALPVPTVGHPARRARIEARAREIGRVHLAGGASGGVGVPDCLATGLAAARALTT
ncbi:protoporphyrinogen oxidase [Sandaracinus amylolyticus]|uniref:protoporphyrinogen oxidase n=1 Tax=Sandaracinus amylolyticus TaxID=927083 RepID=UPI001F2BE449|nr:protoporphyrinogen oxidase [Sandaracinus amylolyticus]UJR84149.1 Hypothetical protein I5071_62200 [Sandaracinus amylolyticus]